MGNSRASRDAYNEKRRQKRAEERKSQHRKASVVPPDLDALIRAAKSVVSFEELCDALGRPPSAVRSLLTKAETCGVQIQIENDHIHLSPSEQIRTVQHARIQPPSGERRTIGVISDLHLGSKYCLRDQLRDCVEHFYARGIRNILVPGDLLDGCYRHGVFELSHTGLEDQTRDLFETLPCHKGLIYHCITGNHDDTFRAVTGVNVGAFIQGYFRARNRNDIRFYGDCGAFVEIFGVVIHLWHPLKGMAYAHSYQLQKQIESYGSGEKPDILLAGHWHKFNMTEGRGIYAIACPTFQASGSVFSKRLGGQPALGGVILSWELAGKDLIRDFLVERRRYFEVEMPTKIKSSNWVQG